MSVHINSRSNWNRYKRSNAPSKQQRLILQALHKANRPLTYFEIAEATKLPVHYMGELIGKGLIQMGLIYEVRYQHGVSPRKHKCKLVVSKRYINSNPNCPEVINDPRGRSISDQLSIFQND